MRVRNDGTAREGPLVRFVIEGLTAGQLAYIVGVVGSSNSLVNTRGGLMGSPVVPDAQQLHQPLQLAAIEHGLEQLVDQVIQGQERWQRQNRLMSKEDVAS